MRKISALILLLSLIAGCESPKTPSQAEYEQVSSEIERIKAQAESASFRDNIKVVVNMLSVSRTDKFAIDSLWQYADKNVTVTKRPDAFSRSGLKIGLAGPNFKTRLDITKQQLKSSESTELFLVLTDGATGFINIGTEIYVPRFYYFGRWYNAVDYEFRQAGRYLKVAVRKLPSGHVDMELTPVFSKFLNNQGDLELTELSTRVTALPGQTIIIGGGSTAGESVATALLSYSKQGQTKETLITVTPHTQ